MELTAEQIKKINSLAPNEWQTNEQGVYTQPYGIPVHIKTPVIYMRWETGGVSGGSCWDSSNPQPYTCSGGKPKFEVLDLVLKEICPNITFLQFREIENLIKQDSKTDYEYYGNCTEFDIEYIVLEDLFRLLASF